MIYFDRVEVVNVLDRDHGKTIVETTTTKTRLMSNACTPILVGVPSPVSEILLPSKTTKFPFPTMDYTKMAKFPFPTMDYIVHGHQKI